MSALSGRIAAVSGGTSGIGEAIVRRLVADGARVACVARREPAAPLPDGAAFFAADVRDVASVEAACVAAHERWGGLDIAVAAAGVAHQGTLSEGDPSAWREVVETNVLGTANLLRCAVRIMRERGAGHLVLVASVAGRGTHAGEPVYLASKWAVVGLGHALRHELLDDGIRVTLVEPGLVDTPLTRAAPAAAEWLASVDPLVPDDIAGLVAEALAQPPRVSVGEILVRPSQQEL